MGSQRAGEIAELCTDHLTGLAGLQGWHVSYDSCVVPFSAELDLALAEGNELNALVQLYQALGGGWE